MKLSAPSKRISNPMNTTAKTTQKQPIQQQKTIFAVWVFGLFLQTTRMHRKGAEVFQKYFMISEKF